MGLLIQIEICLAVQMENILTIIQKQILLLISIIGIVFKASDLILIILTVLYATSIIYSCRDYPKLLLITSCIVFGLIILFIAAMKMTTYLIENKVFFIR